MGEYADMAMEADLDMWLDDNEEDDELSGYIGSGKTKFDTITFKGVSKAMTEKAALFCINEKDYWLPFSQIFIFSDEPESDEDFTRRIKSDDWEMLTAHTLKQGMICDIHIPIWLMRDKGLKPNLPATPA